MRRRPGVKIPEEELVYLDENTIVRVEKNKYGDFILRRVIKDKDYPGNWVYLGLSPSFSINDLESILERMKQL